MGGEGLRWEGRKVGSVGGRGNFTAWSFGLSWRIDILCRSSAAMQDNTKPLRKYYGDTNFSHKHSLRKSGKPVKLTQKSLP